MLDETEVLKRFAIHREEWQQRELLGYCFQSGLPHVDCGVGTNYAVRNRLAQDETSQRTSYTFDMRLEMREKVKWLNFFHSCECESRSLLERHETEERLTLQRGFATSLGGVLPDLVHASDLDLFDEEWVQRGVIEHSFFDMLLEACSMQETMLRCDMQIRYEPSQREALRSDEVASWISHRQQHLKRKIIEDDYERFMDRLYVQMNFLKDQENAREIFRLHQQEQYERGVVEHQERLSFGFILDEYPSDYIKARICQLRFEMYRRSVDLSQSTIGVDETTARSQLLLSEKAKFESLHAREVKSFLLARHKLLTREREQRAMY